MKRVALIAVAVGALASVNVSAQTARVASSGSAAGPTFAKDVAPIMYNKCATCHRPGEVAPMSLMSYEDARPWAKAIK
jgi:cytochrome c553